MNSTITDAIRIKKATAQNSSLRRVALLERSTIKNCVVNDCIIYKTDFENMLLENGIWKKGCLVGRVDPGREVVIRALEGGEFSGLDTMKCAGKRGYDEKKEVQGDNNDNEEALPVYKS